jgi:hypothetical protein
VESTTTLLKALTMSKVVVVGAGGLFPSLECHWINSGAYEGPQSLGSRLPMSCRNEVIECMSWPVIFQKTRPVKPLLLHGL